MEVPNIRKTKGEILVLIIPGGVGWGHSGWLFVCNSVNGTREFTVDHTCVPNNFKRKLSKHSCRVKMFEVYLDHFQPSEVYPFEGWHEILVFGCSHSWNPSSNITLHGPPLPEDQEWTTSLSQAKVIYSKQLHFEWLQCARHYSRCWWHCRTQNRQRSCSHSSEVLSLFFIPFIGCSVFFSYLSRYVCV